MAGASLPTPPSYNTLPRLDASENPSPIADSDYGNVELQFGQTNDGVESYGKQRRATTTIQPAVDGLTICGELTNDHGRYPSLESDLCSPTSQQTRACPSADRGSSNGSAQEIGERTSKASDDTNACLRLISFLDGLNNAPSALALDRILASAQHVVGEIMRITEVGDSRQRPYDAVLVVQMLLASLGQAIRLLETNLGTVDGVRNAMCARLRINFGALTLDREEQHLLGRQIVLRMLDKMARVLEAVRVLARDVSSGRRSSGGNRQRQGELYDLCCVDLSRNLEELQQNVKEAF